MATPLTADQIYAQLEARVLPQLSEYPTDLTVHDRAMLLGYTGPFLLSYRASGTHLLVLGEPKEFLIAGDPRTPSEQVERTFDRKRAEVSSELQTNFLHFDGAAFHTLTRAEALRLVDAHMGQVLAAVKTQKSAFLA